MGPGSFPFFRMGTKPMPSLRARQGPMRKPRESRPGGSRAAQTLRTDQRCLCMTPQLHPPTFKEVSRNNLLISLFLWVKNTHATLLHCLCSPKYAA